jgi:hypothetical protein
VRLDDVRAKDQGRAPNLQRRKINKKLDMAQTGQPAKRRYSIEARPGALDAEWELWERLWGRWEPFASRPLGV